MQASCLRCCFDGLVIILSMPLEVSHHASTCLLKKCKDLSGSACFSSAECDSLSDCQVMVADFSMLIGFLLDLVPLQPKFILPRSSRAAFAAMELASATYCLARSSDKNSVCPASWGDAGHIRRSCKTAGCNSKLHRSKGKARVPCNQV